MANAVGSAARRTEAVRYFLKLPKLETNRTAGTVAKTYWSLGEIFGAAGVVSYSTVDVGDAIHWQAGSSSVPAADRWQTGAEDSEGPHQLLQ